MNPKAYRLPTHVFPRRYDVRIDARLSREDVHGSVTIKLDIKESRDYIELHAVDMKLLETTLTAGGKTYKGQVEQDNEREMARIGFDEALPTGEATLEINYDGKISNRMEGLYLAKDGPEKCSAPSARRQRPPHLPLLRRACLQGAVRLGGHHSTRDDRAG